MQLAALLVEAAPRVSGAAENISAGIVEECALEQQSGLIAEVIFMGLSV